MCPDYFQMENPYSDLRTRTRKEEALISELEQSQQAAKFHNSAKANEKPLTGKIKRFCSLCNSDLILTKKVEHIEELNIDLPKWKCKVCSQYYVGIGRELYTPNRKGKAIVFSMDDV